MYCVPYRASIPPKGVHFFHCPVYRSKEEEKRGWMEKIIKDFWGNFMHYECHTRVSANSIKNLLEEETGLLRLILEQKELVRAYADILTDLIMENSENAEYFIEEYMEN